MKNLRLYISCFSILVFLFPAMAQDQDIIICFDIKNDKIIL
jgi:hypothetical protein